MTDPRIIELLAFQLHIHNEEADVYPHVLTPEELEVSQTSWRNNTEMRNGYRNDAISIVAALEAVSVTLKGKDKSLNDAIDTLVTIPAHRSYVLPG